MRIGIFENIMTPGGHEVDFDRILVEELQSLGHEVCFYVPEGFRFAMDYHVLVRELRGGVVSYTGVTGVRKIVRTVRRELYRLRWYRQLYEVARREEVDALIVPTSTYRYLRALKRSVLRKSPVPVLFILHGINPKEAPKFLREADSLADCLNIRPTVLSFGDSIFGEKRANVRLIYPPTFVPRDIAWQPGMPPPTDKFLQTDSRALEMSGKKPLVLGFFGQYRRGKRLGDVFEAYLRRPYTPPGELFLQGGAEQPEDAADFERIIAKYRGKGGIRFLHRGLIGAEWQRAIASVDALLLPYSAPRYRYHWGGMLFTAIGFQKPVVTSDDMNPEVFAAYDIGKLFPSGSLMLLRKTLELFVNGYDDESLHYIAELQKAADVYSPREFVHRIIAIIKE